MFKHYTAGPDLYEEESPVSERRTIEDFPKMLNLQASESFSTIIKTGWKVDKITRNLRPFSVKHESFLVHILYGLPLCLFVSINIIVNTLNVCPAYRINAYCEIILMTRNMQVNCFVKFLHFWRKQTNLTESTIYVRFHRYSSFIVPTT